MKSRIAWAAVSPRGVIDVYGMSEGKRDAEVWMLQKR